MEFNFLEELRSKQELISYLKEKGKNMSNEEIEILKKNYRQPKENINILNYKQLNKVAGGMKLGTSSPKNKSKLIFSRMLPIDQTTSEKPKYGFVSEPVSSLLQTDIPHAFPTDTKADPATRSPELKTTHGMTTISNTSNPEQGAKALTTQSDHPTHLNQQEKSTPPVNQRSKNRMARIYRGVLQSSGANIAVREVMEAKKVDKILGQSSTDASAAAAAAQIQAKTEPLPPARTDSSVSQAASASAVVPLARTDSLVSQAASASAVVPVANVRPANHTRQRHAAALGEKTEQAPTSIVILGHDGQRSDFSNVFSPTAELELKMPKGSSTHFGVPDRAKNPIPVETLGIHGRNRSSSASKVTLSTLTAEDKVKKGDDTSLLQRVPSVGDLHSNPKTIAAAAAAAVPAETTAGTFPFRQFDPCPYIVNMGTSIDCLNELSEHIEEFLDDKGNIMPPFINFMGKMIKPDETILKFGDTFYFVSKSPIQITSAFGCKTDQNKHIHKLLQIRNEVIYDENTWLINIWLGTMVKAGLITESCDIPFGSTPGSTFCLREIYKDNFTFYYKNEGGDMHFYRLLIGDSLTNAQLRLNESNNASSSKAWKMLGTKLAPTTDEGMELELFCLQETNKKISIESINEKTFFAMIKAIFESNSSGKGFQVSKLDFGKILVTVSILKLKGRQNPSNIKAMIQSAQNKTLLASITYDITGDEVTTKVSRLVGTVSTITTGTRGKFNYNTLNKCLL